MPVELIRDGVPRAQMKGKQMNNLGSSSKPIHSLLIALLAAAFVAGCGGGSDGDKLFGSGAGVGNSAGSPGPAGAAPALGAAAPFGFFSSAALTNQGTATAITGNAGTTSTASSITGFHDAGGHVYTETLANIGSVTGTIYASDAPIGDPAGLGTTSTA